MSQGAFPRRDIDRLWWWLALALVAGLCGYWPYLRRENARLETWEILAIWSSEVMAVFWFLRYGLGRLASRRRGMDARRISRLSCQWVVISTGISLGIDWAITLRSYSIEREAFARAAIAAGQVVDCDIDIDWFGLHRQYTLACRFQDGNQVAHEVTFVLAGRDTPPNLARVLAGGPFPLALPIAYDPGYPRRSWVAGVPLKRQDGNRLYQMSTVAVLFNTLLFANLALWSILLDWPAGLVPVIHTAPVAVITFLLWMGLVIDHGLRFATRRWW
jgi:hypothetical protein